MSKHDHVEIILHSLMGHAYRKVSEELSMTQIALDDVGREKHEQMDLTVQFA